MPDLVETTPIARYSRTPPCLFNAFSRQKETLRNHYTMLAQREVLCPAEGFQHFDRCHVYDGAYVLLGESGWFAPSIANYAIAGQIEPALLDLIAQGKARRASPGPPMVLIAQAGYANHGHVLADMLPKLINVARAGLVTIRLLLPDAMRPFDGLIQAVTRALGVAAEIKHVAEGTLCEVEDAYVFSAVSQHDSRKSPTLATLRELVLRVYDITPSPERRLFIRRGGHEIRGIANTAEVEAVFAERGFVSIYPPDHTLEAQIGLFAMASDIAGPLGAGLANIAFSPESCQVTMIDPGLIDYYFWDMTCLLSQRFNWFYAGEIRGWSQELSVASYRVDAASLRACLATLYS